MSGADLANLVNEAALFAVRRNTEVHKEDFDAPATALMGLRRESLRYRRKKKEIVATRGRSAVCRTCSSSRIRCTR